MIPTARIEAKSTRVGSNLQVLCKNQDLKTTENNIKIELKLLKESPGISMNMYVKGCYNLTIQNQIYPYNLDHFSYN